MFGVVLTTSYHTAFQRQLPGEARAALPAMAVAEFDDPTLPLDQRRYGRVQALVREQPGGDPVLASAVSAQRQGVVAATRHIFQGATALVLLAIGGTVLLREVPLRRTFDVGPSSPAAEPPARPGSDSGPVLASDAS